MTKTMPGHARALLLSGACLLVLVALAFAPWPAQANPAQDVVCLREGALAEKLALARDNGMTMPEAIEAVLSENLDARRERVAAQAALLFQRFRRLPVQQAAFEFQLACVDDAQ
jgi:hypothetical protein